ncbi:hypothetical protein EON81_11625 [bacterium]|nr:MAG: hypothetical protein EON81_11625 [bacterium]
MFRERTYRMNVVLLGLAMTVGCVVVFEVLRMWLEELPHVWESRSIATFLIVGLWIMGAAMWAMFPTFTGRDGLRGTDGIGRFHEVRWEDIQKVSSISGFLWIRHGKPGKALCLPMFLNDWRGFRDDILLHAPEDNPLRAYVMRR